jgi:DDE family transposase
LPFKANADRRHHIPEQRHRVTNWSEYDAALRQRGSLTAWFTEEAIAGWQAERRTTRGGQPSCSDPAIATALTLRAVFRLALRQTEGLIGSLLHLLGLDLAVPDHSTPSRRAETLELPPLRSSPSAMPSRRSTSRKTSRPPSEESCSPSERAIRGLPRTGDRPGGKG